MPTRIEVERKSCVRQIRRQAKSVRFLIILVDDL